MHIHTKRFGFFTFGVYCFAFAVLILSSVGTVSAVPQWIPLAGIPDGFNGNVYAITSDTNGNIYVGGLFSGTADSPVYQVAKWNGSSWVGSFIPDANVVYALAFDKFGNLFASGLLDGLVEWTNGLGSFQEYPTGDDFGYSLAFDTNGNLYEGTDSGVLKWQGGSFTNIGAITGLPAEVDALAFDSSGNLYAGGMFTSIGGVTVNDIAEWNGTNWSPLGYGVGGGVSSLAVDASGNLYAGGAFQWAGFASVTNIARWDGKSWSAVGGGLGQVSGLAFDRNGDLYAACGTVAVWNGTSWTQVGSSPVGMSAVDLAFDALGNLYVGGTAYVLGSSANGIDKLLLNGPNVNESVLQKRGGATNLITYLGNPGSTYVLDIATNISGLMLWTSEATNAASTNGATMAGYVNFTNVGEGNCGIYRVRLLQ